MSKRATESQITKDDYERGDDDGGSVMGTFKKASTEELAKRSIRAMRRTGPRSTSDQDDGASKPPPAFPSFGSFSTPANSQQTSTAAKPANPFAGLLFGSTPDPSTSTATTTSVSTSTFPSSTAASTDSEKKSQPFTGFGQPTAKPSTPFFGFGNGSGNSNAAPAFSSGAFTFNIGSNAKPINVTEGGSPNDSNAGTADNQEGYLRQLRAVNHSFIKRIEKEMERLPTINLAQLFQGYIEVRGKIRKSFQDVEEPHAIIITDAKSGQNSSENSPGSFRGSKISRTGSDSQLQGFGLPTDITAGSNKRSLGSFGTASSDKGSAALTTTSGATASLTAPTFSTAAMSPSSPSGYSGFGGTASMFGFGSSSMKGAVDPPKNPVSSSWNFGTSNNSAAGISTSKPTVSSLNQTSNPFSSSTSASTTTTPKPFTFNPPKPFSLPSSTATTSAAITTGATDGPPKPFAFQVPAMQPTTSSSGTAGQDDNEKMPDDTKSQLVDSREGEEDESTVFETRAKLFACPDKAGGEYKDLGLGQFRINEHAVTKKRRMIMRLQGTGLIVLNSWVIKGMPPVRENKNNIAIFGIEDGKPKKFLVRVKEAATADELVQAVENGQDQEK